jgi:hypothetical protein
MELVESNGGLSSLTCDGRNHVHVGHVPFNVIVLKNGRRRPGDSGWPGAGPGNLASLGELARTASAVGTEGVKRRQQRFQVA